MNTDNKSAHVVYLDWPAPPNVKACFTLRSGGCSDAPYASFNLAEHVGDSPYAVARNREYLMASIGESAICWLQQVHGVALVDAMSGQGCAADAVMTNKDHQVCCVMTADCLPVFFCDRQGTQVAVAHAGWRGLLAGIVQKTLQCFQDSSQVIIYLGPAISQSAFEVGDEVRDMFITHYPHVYLDECFWVSKAAPHKWMADLYGIARKLLNDGGVDSIYGGDRCTFSEKDDFFSYRRDGQTGRMANLIWLDHYKK
jgi:polyphenol oxidase